MTRGEAIKILSSRDGHGIPSGYNGGYAEAIEVAIEALKAEPIKHGRWIALDIKERPFRGFYMCSECNEIANKAYPYCHCGAKMDEVEE